MKKRYTDSMSEAPRTLSFYVMALLFVGVLLSFGAPEASGQVNSYPYTESFETGSQLGPWGAWTRGPRTSDPRWKRDNLTTPSSLTGPSGAYSGSYYIYLEASGGTTFDTDYATAAFNFSSLTIPTMSFYYHMYGSTMGTLAVEASPDNGANWVELWSISGQQHSGYTASWTLQTISLCPFAGLSTVQIRFKGVRGTSFYSDMAVDLVQVFQGTANPSTYVSSTATQANTLAVVAGGSNQDVLGVEIVATGECPAAPVTSFTFNTSGSTNPTGDIDNARLWYTSTSSSFAPAVQYGSTVASPNGSFTFTDNIGVSGGTNYFWLTYDIDPLASVGDVIDAQCTSLTVSGIARTLTVTNPAGSRTIIAPLNGNYTINPSGSGSTNFTSFGDAISTLGIAGVSGPVTFNVAAATYSEQLTLTAVTGASALNTITFDGGVGNAASRIITYSVPTAYQSVITLNGADFIRFKNLTVNSTHGSYGYGFLFTNQASNNEISNCVINLPTNTTSSSHIGIVASSTSTYSASGDWGDNNLIQDNTINSGYFGIVWTGYSNSSNTTIGHDNQFIGNTIQNYYYYGLYVEYSVAVKAIDNTIVQRTSGVTTTGGYGMYFYYPNLGAVVTGNYVYARQYGLYFRYANYNYGAGLTSVQRAMVSNNMIIVDYTSSSTMYGMYTYYSRYTDFVFNTLSMRRSYSTTAASYGIYHVGTSANYDVKFKNNYIAHSGYGTFYAMYNSTLGDHSEYDFNAYWREGTGTNYFYWGGSYTSLAALQSSVSGFHQNSVWGNPYFVSATDLHSRSHVGFQTGTAFAGVTKDFDGDTRNAIPCIGADEYPTPPPENDLTISDVLFDNAVDEWAHREGTVDHAVKVVLHNSGLSSNPTPVTITYKVGSAPVDVNDGVQETFTPVWVGSKASLEFTQKVTGLV
ncbi:MAG: BNR-repeat neuraminidase N-terminal domain-containing protein, partial [Bacteroidota bacterium]